MPSTWQLYTKWAQANQFAMSEKIELKGQLNSNKHHFLVIDLQNTNKNIVQFISLCKKKYRELVIIVVASSGDLLLVKEFFNIGINAFVSTDITGYEFKIALEKTFSGENYVGNEAVH